MKPLAKKPPKGPIIDAKIENEIECNMNGYIFTVSNFTPICVILKKMIHLLI